MIFSYGKNSFISSKLSPMKIRKYPIIAIITFVGVFTKTIKHIK